MIHEKENNDSKKECPICLNDSIRDFYIIRGCNHKICTSCEPTLRRQGIFVNRNYNAIKCPLCRKIEDIPYQQFLEASLVLPQPQTSVLLPTTNNNNFINFTHFNSANSDYL
jgi:hypothetical protein